MRRVLLGLLLVHCAHKEETPMRPADPALSASASVAPSATAVASAEPQFGLIGILAATDGGADGDVGNLWGNPSNDSIGGLGLSGDGGGLGSIGSGQGFGGGGVRHVATGSVHAGQVSVNGRLPPEVIGRIIRQNFGRFRLCYDGGLRSAPSLAGTIVVQFVIGQDGSILHVKVDPSSTIPDTAMRSCVGRAFGNLSFPQPESGVVTVSYPLVFSPP